MGTRVAWKGQGQSTQRSKACQSDRAYFQEARVQTDWWSALLSGQIKHDRYSGVEGQDPNKCAPQQIFDTPGQHQDAPEPEELLLVKQHEERDRRLRVQMSDVLTDQGRTSEATSATTPARHTLVEVGAHYHGLHRRTFGYQEE